MSETEHGLERLDPVGSMFIPNLLCLFSDTVIDTVML